MVEAYLGEIRMFAGDYAPEGWALCQGQTLDIGEHTALYTLLANEYGGDGRRTFKLPDLCGRVPVGQGQGPGLSAYKRATYDGHETVKLTAAEAGHEHRMLARAQDGTLPDPQGNMLAKEAKNFGPPPPSALLAPQAMSPRGADMAHENRQPYLTVNYIICLVGEYPES